MTMRLCVLLSIRSSSMPFLFCSLFLAQTSLHFSSQMKKREGYGQENKSVNVVGDCVQNDT